jgi:DNA-binding transcriptional regulator YiaG
MSEIKAIYDGQSVPLTVEAFKNRPCGLGVEHPDFVLPTPQEIKSLRILMGFSQVDLAKLVGVSWNSKGASSVRKWETIEGKEKRSISPSAWQLMLLKVGLVVIEPLNIFYEK